jgi:hypothetical protein
VRHPHYYSRRVLTRTLFDQSNQWASLSDTCPNTAQTARPLRRRATFIICAPAAFLAFNYITLRPPHLPYRSEHSIVNPQKVAKIFVISDISTFLIQVRINPFNWVYAYSGCSRNVYLRKGWRKWPSTSDKMQTSEKRSFLWALSFKFISYGFFCAPLGQEPHQHQIRRSIPSVQVLQSAYLGVVPFFRLYLRTSASILTTYPAIKFPCRFVVSIVS